MKLNLLALAIGATLTGSASAQISNFCTAQNNSSGTPAALALSGSVNVTDNGLTFTISSLPSFNYNMAQRGTFGVLLASRSFNSIGTTPMGSMGTLCLTSPAFNRSDVIAGDAAGDASGTIDLTSLPASLGSVSAGDTLAFQAWYRDVDTSMGMLATTSNYTNAVQVDFEPPPPSFANEIVPLFGPPAQGGYNCVICHGATPIASAPQDFSFTDPPADIHARLFEIPTSLSGFCPPFGVNERVAPGAPQFSTLYRLVDEDLPCVGTGLSMSMRMNNSDAELVRQWIGAGAPNN